MKINKIFIRISVIFSSIIVFIVVTSLLIFYNSSVQNYIVQKVSVYLSKKIGTNITLKNVDIQLPNIFVLENILIEDQKNDTLIFASELGVDLLFNRSDSTWFNFKSFYFKNPSVKIVNYNESTNNYDFLINSLSSKDKSTKKNIIKFKSINFINGKIAVDSLKFNKINFKISDFNAIDSDINFKINRLNFINEYYHFNVNNVSSEVSINDKNLSIKNLEIKLANSSIYSDIKASYSKLSNLAYIKDSVNFRINFYRSLIKLNDMKFLNKSFANSSDEVIFLGNISGKVNNISSKAFYIQFNKNSSYNGSFKIKEILNKKNTYIDFRVEKLNSNYSDINKIFAYSKIDLTENNFWGKFSEVGNINYKGKFIGFIDDLVSYGEFSTEIGNIKTDFKFKYDFALNKSYYNGQFELKNFNCNIINENLKEVNLTADIVGEGNNFKNLNIDFKSNIEKIVFKDYEYNNVYLNILLKNKVFDIVSEIHNENILMNLKSKLDFSSKIPQYEAQANVTNAKLYKLNLLEKDSLMRVSANINLLAKGNNINNLTGNVNINNLIVYTDGEVKKIKKIDLTTTVNENVRKIILISDLADINIEGKYDLNNIATSIDRLVKKYTNQTVEEDKKYTNQEFVFDCNIKDIDIITKLFVPELKFNDNIIAKGRYNENNDSLKFEISTKNMAFYDKQIDLFNISGKNIDTNLIINLNADSIKLTNNTIISKLFSKTVLNKKGANFSILWGDIKSNPFANKIKSDSKINQIEGGIAYLEKGHHRLHFDKSEILLNDSYWKLNLENEIDINKDKISFDRFYFENGKQRIEFNGAISDNSRDIFEIDLTDFDISFLNTFTGENNNFKGILFGGLATGKIKLSDIYSDMYFISRISIKDFIVNGDKLGDFVFNSNWDNTFNSIGVNAYLLREEMKTMEIVGFYYPNRAINNLDFTISTNKLKIELLTPYIGSYLSDLRGKATGSFKLIGTPVNPILKGKLKVAKGGLKINYLNTKYIFTDNVILDENKIIFDNIAIENNDSVFTYSKAVLSGYIYHKYFRNFGFDIKVKMDEPFYCLNTTIKDNQLFYGSVFATGDIRVSGDVNNVIIDVNAKSARAYNKVEKKYEYTYLNIPITDKTEVTSSNLVSFINKEKSKNIVVKDENSVDLSGIQLNFDIEVENSAEIRLIFDEKIGDVIKGKGNGNIKLVINTLGKFEMYGDYIIDEGNYLFTLQNVINKRFRVKQGGYLKWNGDPYDAIIDVNAIYSIRASLNDLIGNTDTLYNDLSGKRIPVECNLHLTDRLLNPNISFTIDLPDADEDIKTQVKQLINTEEKINKQIFALLALRRFLPANDNNNVNSDAYANSGVKNNTYELLSNQISNWLSQISNDFDVGFKYKKGEEISDDELEIALSTQIFNDRLLIDGNVGMGNNNKFSNSSTGIVGDINVEYKINKDGSLRVKAFNRTNTYRITENDGLYKQGLGIFYKWDF